MTETQDLDMSRFAQEQIWACPAGKEKIETCPNLSQQICTCPEFKKNQDNVQATQGIAWTSARNRVHLVNSEFVIKSICQFER